MKGSHPRPADRCLFVLRHSISQVTSFMQLGVLCINQSSKSWHMYIINGANSELKFRWRWSYCMHLAREHTRRRWWVSCNVVDRESLSIPWAICAHSNSHNIACTGWNTTMNTAAVLSDDMASIQYLNEVRGASFMELQLEVYNAKPNNLKWFAAQRISNLDQWSIIHTYVYINTINNSHHNEGKHLKLCESMEFISVKHYCDIYPLILTL